MFRKFCRVFCLVFLIGDLQTSLSHDNVGKSPSTSVDVNNINTKPLLHEIRHQASIRLLEKEETFGEGHICGGSLISPGVVLTAAHCLFDSNTKRLHHPTELYVVMGSPNRYLKTEHTSGSRVTHIRHPVGFDFATRTDDIGLLFLSQEISDNESLVQPIELSRNAVTGKDARGAVTGWAVVDNGAVTHHVIAMNVSTVDPLGCVMSFKRHITDGMLCVEHTILDEDICHSDAGAPLVRDGRQIGIVSLTNSCAAKDNLGVYTDVAYHDGWIRRELAAEANTDSSIWGLIGFLVFTWYAFKDKPKAIYRFQLQ